MDGVLQALADGRNLVDVATKTLLAKYGEIYCFTGGHCRAPDTAIPGTATAWPPPAVTGTARTGVAPFVATGLPVNASFDGVTILDPLILPDISTAVIPGAACVGLDQPLGDALIVSGDASIFRAMRYADTAPDDPPVVVADLRPFGIGVGDGWGTNPADWALALTLSSVWEPPDFDSHAYVQVPVPVGVDQVRFRWLYWAENTQPDTSTGSLADVVVSAPGVSDRVLDRGTPTAVVSTFLRPCCPDSRMADETWGNPCTPAGGEECPRCIISTGGPLCWQYRSPDGLGCSGTMHTSSACGQPRDTCSRRVDQYSHQVLAGTYQTASVTRAELGIPADAAGSFSVGLRNHNPTAAGCGTDAWGIRACDTVDDRVQIDDLEFLDCEGNPLTTASTEAPVCRVLTANIEAIGVTDELAPGLAEDHDWHGIPSVSVHVGTGLPRVTAVPLRVDDFGWRVLATVSPPPGGADPGSGLAMDCEVCSDAAMTTCDPSFLAVRTGNLLVCVPVYTVPSGMPYWVGGTVRWVDPDTLATVEVELPGVAIVIDEWPPDGGGIFDTFPANHATFLEGDPVFVRAELLDDTTLATYECDPPAGVPGTGFGPAYFPDAHRMPEGSWELLAFEWPTPTISAAGAFAFDDFTLACKAKDAAARETGFDRVARVVRVPDFRVDPLADLPGGAQYHDPARGLRTVDLDADLTVSTGLDAGGLGRAGLLVKYELAIAAPDLLDVTIDEWGGTFTFNQEGVYYLQAVVGRILPDGHWDPVKLSSNAVVVLVTGINAVFLTPWSGSRGVSYPLARFWQDAEVKLVRPRTGADYPRSGVPLEFRTTGGPLQFANYSNVLSGVLTDANGHAVVPLYATGTPGPGTIEVYEMRVPDRRFLVAVPIETSRLRITSPSGDPRGLTGSSDNEFCFDVSDPGVLRVRTTAEWEDGLPIGPCGIDPDSVPCRLTWEIDPIGPPGGPPELRWLPSYPEDPRLGLGAENEATYTGLPPSYRDFGYKSVFLAYDLVPWEVQPIEVFFPAGGLNSGLDCPNVVPGDPCPNFFAYGLQVVPATTPATDRYYDDTLASRGYGVTPAVARWMTFTGPRNTVHVAWSAYGELALAPHCVMVGASSYGWATLANVLRHEGRHVFQVGMYNRLVFYDALTGRVDNVLQSCPSAHCGWAFADLGSPILPGHAYYNRFYDANGDGLPGGAGDLVLDADDDVVPFGFDLHEGTAFVVDGGTTRPELEWVAWTAQECDSEELLGVDYGCPGRQAGRAPQPGSSAPSCW